MIVGELINSSREAVNSAIAAKDASFIRALVQKQAEAGADYIDINCGSRVGEEEAVIRWLVEIALQAADRPLCIDSPSEKALAAGLEAAAKGGKKPLVNSISGEKERYGKVLPLVKQYGASVIGLIIDDQGMPKSYEDRVRIASSLLKMLSQDGIAPEDIYLDPLVAPVSTEESSGRDVLMTIGHIHGAYPGVNTICGLSNISFGLPRRKLLNRVFLVQAMAMGMDAFIIDPLDRSLMAQVAAAQALLGRDPFCGEYLKAYRKGLLD